MTPGISEFLLARIAEDEEWVKSAWVEQSHAGGCDTCGVSFPRFMSDCEAKRRLIAAAESPMVVDPLPPGPPRDHQEGMWNGRFGGLYEAMQFLALPYADHSDYNEAWRP